jgi:hypothetical protein
MKRLPVYLRIFEIVLIVYLLNILLLILHSYFQSVSNNEDYKFSFIEILPYACVFLLFSLKVSSSNKLLQKFKANLQLKGWFEAYFILLFIIHTFFMLFTVAVFFDMLFSSLKNSFSFTNPRFTILLFSTSILGLYILIVDLLLPKTIEKNYEQFMEDQINSINQ